MLHKICTVSKLKLLDEKQAQKLLDLITDHHTVFSLDMQDRGKTNLIEKEIYTKDKAPRKVATHCMPFAVHQELVKQII